jgi:hypothetical protein
MISPQSLETIAGIEWFASEEKATYYGVPRKLDQRKRAAYYARCKKEGDYEQALQQ